MDIFNYFHEIVKPMGTIELTSLFVSISILLVNLSYKFVFLTQFISGFLQMYLIKIKKIPYYKYFTCLFVEVSCAFINLLGSDNFDQLNWMTVFLMLNKPFYSFDNNNPESFLILKMVTITGLKFLSFLTESQSDRSILLIMTFLIIFKNHLCFLNYLVEYICLTDLKYNKKLFMFHMLYRVLIIFCSHVYSNKEFSNLFKNSSTQNLIVMPIFLRVLTHILLKYYYKNTFVDLFFLNSIGIIYLIWIITIFYIIYSNNLNNLNNLDNMFESTKKKILCPGLWNGYISSSVVFLSEASKYGDITVGVYDSNTYDLNKKEFIMENFVRVLIMSNLKCVSDVKTIPFHFDKNYLELNGFDTIIYPECHKTREENGINLEYFTDNKITVLRI